MISKTARLIKQRESRIRWQFGTLRPGLSSFAYMLDSIYCTLLFYDFPAPLDCDFIDVRNIGVELRFKTQNSMARIVIDTDRGIRFYGYRHSISYGHPKVCDYVKLKNDLLYLIPKSKRKKWKLVTVTKE